VRELKKISDKEYKADEGKIIVSKINGLKYKKIKLSNNDTIDNYKEISDISSNSEKPIENEQSKKWGRKND
jgi:hypothetical protein